MKRDRSQEGVENKVIKDTDSKKRSNVVLLYLY